MGKRSSLSAHVAHVEDADDDGHVIPGVEPTYARSTAPSSPRKQQPNTGKSRKESRRADSCSSTDSSDSTAHPVTKGKGKLKSRGDKHPGAVVVSKQRPSVRSAKTMPPPSSRASDEPSGYYTIPHKGRSSRPRAQTRPESYYGQSASRPPPRQPMSGSPYYQQPPPPNMVPPSFPPPSWAVPFSGPGSGPGPGPGPMPMPMHHPPPLPPPPADHHFTRDLAMRFKPPPPPMGRPSSALGYRHASNPYDYEHVPEKSVPRRSSVSRKASKDIKEQEDRRRMPPPPRPKSARPERIILKAQPAQRKSVNFEDEDLDDIIPRYPSIHRRESGVEYGSIPFDDRRQSYDAAESIFDYEDDEDEDEDEEPYYIDPLPRSRSRRRSQVNIEDKIRNASLYQDNIGGPGSALTAEALRKVKTGGSSRSTRSSASRDESEFRHSATTHTTRSSSGEDDITIKVSEGCVVEIAGAKIHCTQGGNISVARTGSSRSGSDRGTSIYGDDRRSRSDRSSASRTRASSQAAYARGLPAPSLYASSPYAPSPLTHNYGYSDYSD